MHMNKEREKERKRKRGTWKSLEFKVFFFFPHPYPLALAVNKSTAVYIYHARSRTLKRKYGVCEQAIKVLKGLWHPMRMCGIFISGLAEPFFKIGFWWKKSSSIDPEMPEKAIISVFKSHLVNFGSFKRRIWYFCASIVEQIRSHRGEAQTHII